MANERLPQASVGSLPLCDQADSATGAQSAAVHPFTVGETPYRPYLRPHRIANATRDDEMLAAVEQRLREGSPKRGAKHVRLTDSRMVGPNEFEELGNPFHWTTWACVIVATLVGLYFVGQLVRGFLAAVFA
jgi:hypothetical protein